MKRNAAGFHRARQAWSPQVNASTTLSSVTKVFASALMWHFKSNRWKATGVLDAGGQSDWGGGIGYRRLQEETNLRNDSINRAIQQLVAQGFLEKIKGGFDPDTGKKTANKYYAKMPPEQDNKVAPFDHPHQHRSSTDRFA
jgi:hypothetical protein